MTVSSATQGVGMTPQTMVPVMSVTFSFLICIRAIGATGAMTLAAASQLRRRGEILFVA
jgi:hypothetical protein